MTQDKHERRRIPPVVAALCGALAAAAAFAMIASGEEARVVANANANANANAHDNGTGPALLPPPQVEGGTLEALPAPGCGGGRHARADLPCAAPAPCPPEGRAAHANANSACGEPGPFDCGNSRRGSRRPDVACVVPLPPRGSQLGGAGCERAVLKPLGSGGAHPAPPKPYPGRSRR